MNDTTSIQNAASISQHTAAIEKTIGEIVMDCLGYELERAEDFFEIGLSSLSMMRVFSRVQAHFDVEIELEDAFDNPTVAEIALLIEQALMRKVELLTDEEADALLDQVGED